MLYSNKAITPLKEPEGAFLINLSKFPGGALDCLKRIPLNTAGVYSWFRAFNYPNDVDELYEKLIQDIEKVKFIERKGSIKPYYEISVRSKSWISEGKRRQIKSALEDEKFKQLLIETLNQSILLQTPLYVGKSSDLRKRIGQHLSEDSILKARLLEASIQITETMLLLVPTTTEEEYEEIDEETEGEEDDDENVGEDPEHEELFEEIVSRLFSPQFTIRLG
jgi:hypothetical protein